jgi:hypothetical protein
MVGVYYGVSEDTRQWACGNYFDGYAVASAAMLEAFDYVVSDWLDFWDVLDAKCPAEYPWLNN